MLTLKSTVGAQQQFPVRCGCTLNCLEALSVLWVHVSATALEKQALRWESSERLIWVSICHLLRERKDGMDQSVFFYSTEPMRRLSVNCHLPQR